MTSPSDATSAATLQSIRERIAAAGLDPAPTPEDFGQLAAEAQEVDETGRLARRSSSLRVRLFGVGVGVGEHDVPVHEAALLLDVLRGAVTATGEAVRGSGALPTGSADAQRSTSEGRGRARQRPPTPAGHRMAHLVLIETGRRHAHRRIRHPRRDPASATDGWFTGGRRFRPAHSAPVPARGGDGLGTTEVPEAACAG